MELVKHAPLVAEEAVALHSAAACPEKGTLILGGSQLGLQIHESVGHPIELDRVLARKQILPVPVFSLSISSII
jgi:TldD protein